MSPPAPPSPEQRQARERWQARWKLPILLAALIPLFVTSPKSGWVEVVVGLGSWAVFVIDLAVQWRLVPGYLHAREGKLDLAIVLVTFPYYLISGISGYSAVLLLARLARVVRLLLATGGLRRFAARLGQVTLVAGLIVLIASLSAYHAEHPTNPGFKTIGDALWWGVVTLTTVGYGDIVPDTAAGRFAGIAIMVTGIAVLGVLAGSLSALFGVQEPSEDEQGNGTTPSDAGSLPVHTELATLQTQLRAIEQRLGELAQRTRVDGPDPLD